MIDRAEAGERKSIWDRVRRRKVIQWGFAYAAGAWALLQVLGFAADAFAWPSAVKQIAMLILLIGLAVVLVLAWYHGDRVERVLRPLLPDREGTSVPTVHAGVSTATFVQPAGTAPTSIPEKSIAVLPFVDMSAERDQQYLGDGIAEELLNALASIEALKVAARTSSFSFAGKGASMKEIADTLHVRTVLEGSVRRSGQKLRITAQLIDVDTGFHLYSQSYDREVQDIFDIQNEIAREIVRALLPKIGLDAAVGLVRQGTSSLEAYNLRLLARQWLTQPSPAVVHASTEQLKEAIRLDPGYAEAWGDMAYIHGFVASWATDPLPHLIDGHHAAETALALSPDNVEGLLFRAYASLLVRHDAKASDHYYQRARDAGADLSVWAFNRAVLHDHPMGRFEIARPYLEEAERRDPLAHNVKWMLAWNYYLSGRHADAVGVAEQLRRLGVSAPDGIAVWGVLLGATAARQARESLTALVDAVPEFAHVGHMYQFTIDGAIGDLEHARTLLDGLLAQSAAQLPVSPIVIAEGYKALGKFDDAIDWWSRAVDQHVPYTLAWMAATNRTHPVIGSQPRFLALLKRMALEGEQMGAGVP